MTPNVPERDQQSDNRGMLAVWGVGRAHWFPDTITVTVPFSRPA